MRLTLHTDYPLRVLMHAGLKSPELSTIHEIAEHFDISKNHLMKVALEPGQKGYLETVRGKHGGVRLTRDPSRINIGEVVRDSEEELGIAGCLQSPGYCRVERACALRRALCVPHGPGRIHSRGPDPASAPTSKADRLRAAGPVLGAARGCPANASAVF